MAHESLGAMFGRPAPAPDHIVDRLIAERGPALASSRAWPLLRPILNAVLGYRDARRMADAVAPLGGRAAFDFVSGLLGLRVDARGLERLPRAGRVILVCNHPTGIADGVAVYDPLKPLRPEMMFYANADAHRVCARLDEVLIPVDWVEAKRTLERVRITVAMTRKAMEQERALVIFPAGRLARWTPGRGMTDPAWAPGAFTVARKFDAPILPVHVDGPPSRLFHLFHQFSGELRDMTLFHELLNKRGKTFRLTVGPLIPPGDLPADSAEAARAMKVYVETSLAVDPDRPFQ
jgi:putative hemolysin